MNRTQLVVFGIIGAVILIGGIIFFGRKPSPPAPASLEFWGVEDDEEAWKSIIDAFRKQYPHLTVSYRRFDQGRFEETLVNRLAEGSGPDVFMLKNSLARTHRDKLFALDAESSGLAPKDFRAVFVDIAGEDLITPEGNILGVPLFVDTLALFYNKDIFNAGGIPEPPKTWEEAVAMAKKLTVLSPAGDVTRSGITLGTFDNIERAYEIVSALLLQKGNHIVDRRTGAPALATADESLRFYASFADPANSNYSWSSREKQSFTAFAEGTAAMAFGFSSDIPRIRARNQHLALGVAPFPQPQNTAKPLSYGAYHFVGVSKLGKNPEAAWQFALFAASRDGAKLYAEAVKKPPARRDLLRAGTNDEILDIFWKQSLIAASWLPPDEQAARRLLKNAIESILSKASDPQEAVRQLEDQLRLITP